MIDKMLESKKNWNAIQMMRKFLLQSGKTYYKLSY